MSREQETAGNNDRPKIRVSAHSAFVGRTRENDELNAALNDSMAGNGRLYLLVGEAGIGKTTLANQLAVKAASQGAQVLWAPCWEGGVAPGFWPWTQALRSCIKEHDPILVRSLIGGDALEMASLSPHFTSPTAQAVVAHKKSPQSPLEIVVPGEDEAQEQLRFRLFDEVTSFLQKIASLKPLLIIFDDCHAADEGSLLLLQFFARNIRRSRIMAVVTYREPEARLSPRVSQKLSEIAREGCSIALGGIGESSVRHFLELTSGFHPDPVLVSALYHATEGNPLFLSEIVKLLLAEGTLLSKAQLGRFEVPDTLRSVIRRRLNFVSERTRVMLRVASIIGREFSLPLLQKLVGETADQLHDCMDEAIAATLVTAERDGIDVYRFRHALIPETLSNDFSKVRRRSLHLQAARGMEELYSETMGSHLSKIAYHYFESLYSGQVPIQQVQTAIQYAERAAQQAHDSLAYEEAARLFHMAIKASDLLQPADRQHYSQLLIAHADSCHRAGLFDDSRNSYKIAAEMAKHIGDAKLHATAVLGMVILPSDPGTVNQANVAILEDALQLLGKSDNPIAAMLMARLAWEHHWSEVGFHRELMSRSAVDMARRVGEESTLIYTLIHRHLAMWGPDNLEERLSIARETVGLCDKSESKLWAPQARHLRMVDLLELGDVEAVDQEIALCLRVTEKSWLPLGYKERAQATRALMKGDFEESEKLAKQALALGQQLGRRAQVAFIVYLLCLRREQGRLAEFQPMLTTSTIDTPSIIAIWRCWQALCCVETGALTEASNHFRVLADAKFGAIRRDTAWLHAISLLAEICPCVGDSTQADVLYQMLLPYSSRNVVVDLNAAFGSVSHYLGILATQMSRFEEARVHFENALELHRQMASPPFLARTHCEYAAMLFKRSQPGDRERARSLSGTALETAEALGMLGVTKKSRKLHGDERNNSLKIVEKDREQLLPQRRLITLLFADIVGSTEHAVDLGDRGFVDLLDTYYTMARSELAKFQGREISSAGDSIFTIFDTPTSAIMYACTIRDAVRKMGIELRVGLHAGECEIDERDVRGIAVHIASRISAAAGPNEILVSGTMKNLVTGGGISFIDRGLQVLKGVPESHQLYLVETTTSLMPEKT